MVENPYKDELKREKLTIYLVKKDVSDDKKNPDDFIEEDPLIDTSKTKDAINIKADGCDIKLYAKKFTQADYPKWSNFLTTTNLNSLEGVLERTNSTGAILLVKACDREFLITFGSSLHIINSRAIERDFGLKVTLNSVDPKKLRSLDKASYDHNPLNSRNQSAIDSDIFDLNMDAETDLVYALTGTSSLGVFGTQITGRDALIVNPYVSLDTLNLILKAALNQYNKPLPDEFKWVDNVSKVKDEKEILHLEKELDKHLKLEQRDDFVHLGEPEIVDWEDHLGYSFDLRPRTERHVTLILNDLKAYIEGKALQFDSENIKKQHVHINDNDYKVKKTWSAYRCLHAEITKNKEQFILRNGIWYRVNNDLLKDINSYISTIPTYQHELPEFNHKDEGSYNNCVHLNNPDIFALLDKKNINFGGSYSKIEFCDLVRNGKDFIHVKCYKGSSSLSHLFYQGLVSAEIFVSDKNFRSKLNKKLPSNIKLADINIRPNSSEYQVVYAIASTKKDVKDLPFFSKVSLKNAVKRLKGLGFEVSVSFIKVNKSILVKKKMKSATAKGVRIRR